MTQTRASADSILKDKYVARGSYNKRHRKGELIGKPRLPDRGRPGGPRPIFRPPRIPGTSLPVGEPGWKPGTSPSGIVMPTLPDKGVVNPTAQGGEDQNPDGIMKRTIAQRINKGPRATEQNPLAQLRTSRPKISPKPIKPQKKFLKQNRRRAGFFRP